MGLRLRYSGAMLGVIILAIVGLSAPAFAADVYVGNAVCKDCHADIWSAFYKNPHYKSIASGKLEPYNTGCEGCHGPGKEHVDAGGGANTIQHAFSLMSPNNILETCLRCHSQTLSRSNIRRSTHTQEDVVCTNCPSIHKPQTPKFTGL